MKLTKEYLTKVIKEEINKTVEEAAGDTAALEMSGGKEGFDYTPGGKQRTDSKKPEQKGDVEKISKVMEKLPQLQRLFGMINTEDELSQVLDNLISGVSGAKTINAAMLTKILRAKASEAGGLSGEK
jgi:hypothetical protein